MNSSSKGSAFEREISKELSLWWSEGKNDNIFYRSQSSGARATQRNKKGKETVNQHADITCSDPEGELLIKNWNIECKTGYSSKTKSGATRWDVLDFIDSKQKEPILEKMWTQCLRDAELTNRQPVLIFRRNNRTPCIMLHLSYMNRLFDFFNNNYSNHIELHCLDDINCMIMNLSDFFKWIPNIRSALK